MSDITKIIISVIAGVFSFSILYSIFKFIIMNYFKKILENEKRINEIEKKLILLEDHKKNP